MKWGVTKNSVLLPNTSRQFHQTAKGVSPAERKQSLIELKPTEYHRKEVWRTFGERGSVLRKRMN